MLRTFTVLLLVACASTSQTPAATPSGARPVLGPASSVAEACRRWAAQLEVTPLEACAPANSFVGSAPVGVAPVRSAQVLELKVEYITYCALSVDIDGAFFLYPLGECAMEGSGEDFTEYRNLTLRQDGESVTLRLRAEATSSHAREEGFVHERDISCVATPGALTCNEAVQREETLPPVAPEAAEAIDTYREALEAYTSGDRAAYRDAFADEICARDGATRSRQEFLTTRAPEGGVHVHHLDVLRVSSEEVALAEFGLWYEYLAEGARVPRRNYVRNSDDAVHQGFHQKRVVLRRAGDQWQIVAETPLQDAACGQDADEISLPTESAQFARCADEHSAALRACDAICDGTPSNQCNVCPNEALCAAVACLGIEDGPMECYPE
ncbi:MAG: hypothetical protein AAGE52_27100 [Myxococcota bacterium]